MGDILIVVFAILIISMAAYAFERISKEREGYSAATKRVRRKSDN